MPNWCSNSIKISGPYDKLKKIKEDSSKFEADEGLVAPGLLEALVPIGDWSYVTASEAWGTKWVLGDLQQKHLKHTVMTMMMLILNVIILNQVCVL